MEKKPQRLLCTWHVVKNWNIQGKSKIKSMDVKKSMKSDLKNILNETKKEKFISRTEEYMKKLTEANETEFLNYLNKYYFQSEDRISMWAHCYRINAGINRNMALESLNNLLKTNQIKRKSHITVENLLDKIDKLVDEKMWQRILNMERPNANTYQDKVVMRAHQLAVKMDKNNVTEVGFGAFKVKSSSENLYYNVSYNELCERECKTLYCRACQICIHRYKCECQQYAVKTTICKHVHLVCLYEKARSDNFVLEDVSNLLQEEESTIKTYHQEEIDTFLTQKNNHCEVHMDRETQLKIAMEAYKIAMEQLDNEAFQVALKDFGMHIEKVQNQNRNSRKCKMVKQEYFPSKKK